MIIYRQDAIDVLHGYFDGVLETDTICPKDIYNLFEIIPSAQPKQQWIPSGKKPPEEGSYLVWMPYAQPKHRIAVAEYCGGYWNIKTPISAWMPLPEPYGDEQG